MKQLAHIVTDRLINAHIIEKEEAEIYDYGLQLLLTSGTTTIVILLIGIISQKLTLTLLFMLALVLLRRYAGGYHAQTYLHCFLISCSVYLGMLISVHFAKSFLGAKEGIILSLVTCSYLCFKGSINSEKNQKTEEQMQQREKLTRILTCILTSCSIILFCRGLVWQDIAWLLVYVQTVTAVGMLAEQQKRKRKRK